MYSVVLMMAVTAGGESADLGRGCRGCGGCYTGGYACGGSGCYSACSGCRGGCLFRGGRKCNGCTSYGCTGYSGHGCHAYCSGVVIVGCHGCTRMAPATGTGTGTGTTPRIERPRTGGTEGGGADTGNTELSADEQKQLKEMQDKAEDAAARMKLAEDFKKMTRAQRKAAYDKFKMPAGGGAGTGDVSTTAAPATLVVNLPATATLTVDGHRTTLTSAERTFVSPTLQPGRAYAYTLRAEFDRDGERVAVSRRVEVWAGRTTRVNLNSGTAVAAR